MSKDEATASKSTSGEYSLNKDAIMLLCTCPASDDWANRLAAPLVEKRLAAGVNILPAVQSVYRWQGKVETAAEQLLLIETTTVKVADVTAWLMSAHPYELPKIITVPISGGLNEYLEWITENSF